MSTAGTTAQAQDLAYEFLTLASINNRVNLNAVASLTWIAYDIVTCFDREVELIWRARWTIPKALYICLRYYGLLWLVYQTIVHLTPGSRLSKLTCESFPALQAMGPVVLWILVDMIMILRICALYQKRKSVLCTLFFSWIGENLTVQGFLLAHSSSKAAASVVITFTIFCFRLSRPIPAPPPFTSIAGCFVPSIDWHKMQKAKIAIIAFILLNVFYLLMTLYKFTESVLSLKKLEVQPMFGLLIRDGVFYFLGCVVARVADLVFSSGSQSLFPYSDLSQFWSVAFFSYAGCHLVLHLRGITSTFQADQAATYHTESTEPEDSGAVSQPQVPIENPRLSEPQSYIDMC